MASPQTAGALSANHSMAEMRGVAPPAASLEANQLSMGLAAFSVTGTWGQLTGGWKRPGEPSPMEQPSPTGNMERPKATSGLAEMTEATERRTLGNSEPMLLEPSMRNMTLATHAWSRQSPSSQ